MNGPVAILGATGVMGRLTARVLADRGVPLRLAARSLDALHGLAVTLPSPGPVELVQADATDRASLDRVVRGASVLLQCAGPYALFGDGPIAAALSAGVHILDLAGEQAWVAHSINRHDAEARRAGVVVGHAMGVEVQLADLAAHALRHRDPTIHTLTIGHIVRGFASSAGSRASASHVLHAPGVAWRDGAWRPVPPGSSLRRIAFSRDFGEQWAVAMPGVELLTIPRHWPDLRTVMSYIALPAPVALGIRALAPAGHIARRWPLPQLLAPVLARVRSSPEPTDANAAFEIVLSGAGGQGPARLQVSAHAPYGLSARLLAHAAETLRSQGPHAQRGGVLAPAQIVDPHVTWQAWQDNGWIRVQ